MVRNEIRFQDSVIKKITESLENGKYVIQEVNQNCLNDWHPSLTAGLPRRFEKEAFAVLQVDGYEVELKVTERRIM